MCLSADDWLIAWAHSMALPMQARSRRSVAGKDIMLDPRAGIRKAGAMPPLMALLKEVVEVREFCMENRSIWASPHKG